MRKSHIAVAMSGGVDSSVTAALLKKAGHEVTGIFMRLGGGEEDSLSEAKITQNLADVRAVAEACGIRYQELDLREAFCDVTGYFVNEYVRGRTPNPCLFCNRRIKFGLLFEHARRMGAEKMATGHYVRIEHDDAGSGRHVLRQGHDHSKDQSYVLFALSQAQLANAVFPMGSLIKKDVRQIAKELQLPISEKSDSQDICFVPDGDYRGFLARRNATGKSGCIEDTAGKVLAAHDGIGNFTVGQRRGLGIATGVPMYVLEIRADTGAVIVGTKDETVRDHCTISQTNWVSIPEPDKPLHVRACLRYHHKGVGATVRTLADGRAEVCFDTPTSDVTPGQGAVFYKEDMLLGGGWIDGFYDDDL